jgi:hypothetical protein
MPFLHTNWCDPRHHHLAGIESADDLVCRSDVYTTTGIWAQLEQGVDDTRPFIHLHPDGHTVSGPFDVKLSCDAAVSLVSAICTRPGELVDLLDTLVEVASRVQTVQERGQRHDPRP